MKKMYFIFILLFVAKIAFAQYLFTVQISANKLEYDNKRGLIYATVKGSASNYANSLVAINPKSGSVVKNIFIGSEPSNFVFTTDSNFLFICFDEQAVVKKFDLESFKIVQEIALGVSKYNGSFYGKFVSVLPNNDSVVVVSRKYKGVSPDFGGVAVYSNGKKLKNETQDHHGPQNLLNTGKSIQYAYDGYGFYKLNVSVDSGVNVISENEISGLSNAKYENGLVFDDRGVVINPSTLTQVGKFSLSDTWESYPQAADSIKNKVFFSIVNDNNKDLDLYSYDRTKYSKISKNSIPNVISTDYEMPECKDLIRFGNNGLAAIIFDDYYFSEKQPSLVILNNSSFVDTTPSVDTSGLAKLFILDTVYTYKHVVVYDTIDIYNHIAIYDTTHLSTTDTLIVFSKMTNVNGNYIESIISIYPNPTSDNLNIKIKNGNVISNYSVIVYDLKGIQVYKSNLVSDNLLFNVSNLTNGTYIVQIKNQFGDILASKYVIKK